MTDNPVTGEPGYGRSPIRGFSTYAQYATCVLFFPEPPLRGIRDAFFLFFTTVFLRITLRPRTHPVRVSDKRFAYFFPFSTFSYRKYRLFDVFERRRQTRHADPISKQSSKIKTKSKFYVRSTFALGLGGGRFFSKIKKGHPKYNDNVVRKGRCNSPPAAQCSTNYFSI